MARSLSTYTLVACALLNAVFGRYLDYNNKADVDNSSTTDVNHDDAFYLPPEGFETASPGTILRHRSTPRALWMLYGSFDAQESWQFLVRLQDTQDRPIAIITTVIRPFNANTLQILSYQVAQDSANSQCAPSYLLQQGASLGDTITLQPEFVLIRQKLREGNCVVVPDHQGPLSGFTVGRLLGKTTLDSLRAVYQSSNITGIRTDAVLVMWGYLGGSIALAWATVLQPHYAPELTGRIVGVTVGGLVTNITAVAEAVDGTYLSGLITNAIRGLVQEYPKNVADCIQSSLTPLRAQHMPSINDLCLMTTIERFAGFHYFEGLDRYFKQGWDLVRQSPIVEVIHANTLAADDVTSQAPSVPILLYHGQRDRVAPIYEVFRVFNTWCDHRDEADTSLIMSVNQNSGHLSEFAEGLEVASVWIRDRFAGKSLEKGCSLLNRTGGRPFSL